MTCIAVPSIAVPSLPSQNWARAVVRIGGILARLACAAARARPSLELRPFPRAYSTPPEQLAPPWRAQSSFFIGLHFAYTHEDATEIPDTPSPRGKGWRQTQQLALAVSEFARSLVQRATRANWYTKDMIVAELLLCPAEWR
eukprot:SAG11_NODE_2766_length_2998_cov_1.572611_2_plen_142_part_00